LTCLLRSCVFQTWSHFFTSLLKWKNA